MNTASVLENNRVMLETPRAWSIESSDALSFIDLCAVELWRPSDDDTVLAGGDWPFNDMKARRPLGIFALEAYLNEPELIPPEFDGHTVAFWGTVYRSADGYRAIRCMHQKNGVWRTCFQYCQAYDWRHEFPAALQKQST